MPPKIRELKAELLREGFEQRPGSGSHTVWYHPLLPAERVVLAGNDGDDAGGYLVRKVRNTVEKLRAVRRRGL